MVSEKHANFIINLGNAKAADIYALIQKVRSKVLEEKGILLEPEITLVGDFEKESTTSTVQNPKPKRL